MDYPKEIDVHAYSATVSTAGSARTTLAEDSLEYHKVKTLFTNHLRGEGYTVSRIEALNNPATFGPFAANVERYKEKPGATVMRLLHGTPAENVEGIVQSNLLLSRNNLTDFNRRTRMYCGDGIYFTDSAPYARAYAQQDPATGLRYLFLCDVLVGKVWRGSRRFPPAGYDTARPLDLSVDGYAKFADSEFYPTHLIVLQDREMPMPAASALLVSGGASVDNEE